MRISIACGGTGGHTFPGLATGRVLAARGHDVEVLSAGRAIEGATLKGWDGAVFQTGAPKSPGRHPLRLAASVARLLSRFSRRRPDAVLAMGSYASLPPVLAARLLGIPAVLHEANAVPGQSIAFLSRFAKAVAVSFPECADRFRKGTRTAATGLPVRLDLLEQPPLDWENAADEGTPGRETRTGLAAAPQKEARGAAPRTVFVTGGSQGAYSMNKRVAEALAALAARPGAPRFRVVHQTGTHEDAEEWTRRRYADAGIDALVFPFVSAMGGAYKTADLVVARSGAATCAEISLFGKPAVFIPLPNAPGDHQYLNAKHFADAGAAKVLRQDDCSPDALADAVSAALADEGMRKAAEAGRDALRAEGADGRLADLVEEMAG